MKVVLSRAESKIAAYIGKLRRRISVKYQRETRANFTPDGLNNEAESSAAELAVAKALNVFPEWSPTAGPVPKFDLVWGGRHVDVKSTQAPDGNLLIPHLNRSLTYFLVRGRMPSFDIVGYLEGEQVLVVGRWVEKMSYKPCWVVPAEKLIKFEGGRP